MAAVQLIRIDEQKNQFEICEDNIKQYCKGLRQGYKFIMIVGRNYTGNSYIMNVLRQNYLNEPGLNLSKFKRHYRQNWGLWGIHFDGNTEECSYMLCESESIYELCKDEALSAKLFVASVLLSSCLIINNMNNIDTNELSFLRIFVRNINCIPQSKKLKEMIFLANHLSFKRTFEFGEGGKEYFALKIEIPGEDHDFFKKLTCFYRVPFFLFPSPDLFDEDAIFNAIGMTFTETCKILLRSVFYVVTKSTSLEDKMKVSYLVESVNCDNGNELAHQNFDAMDRQRFANVVQREGNSLNLRLTPKEEDNINEFENVKRETEEKELEKQKEELENNIMLLQAQLENDLQLGEAASSVDIDENMVLNNGSNESEAEFKKCLTKLTSPSKITPE